MHLWKKERKKSSLFFSGNDIKCDFLIWYHDIDRNYLGAGLYWPGKYKSRDQRSRSGANSRHRHRHKYMCGNFIFEALNLHREKSTLEKIVPPQGLIRNTEYKIYF